MMKKTTAAATATIALSALLVGCGSSEPEVQAKTQEAASAPVAAEKSVLERVKEKGFLQCGVSQGLPGFSNTDESGNWSGLDVDFCRVVAAAILGTPIK